MASGNKKTGGMACCIPSCLSKHYRDGVETCISLFRFPQIKKMNMLWKKAISPYRRKGGADKFNISIARICDFHFTADDIKRTHSSYSRGKRLKNNVVPSIFHSGKSKVRKPWRTL